MSQTRPNLQNAKDILDIINNEKICSSQDTSEQRTTLRLLRELTGQFANDAHYAMPGMTANVASTLLKVGLCQELSQRYALEYMIKYKSSEISLIFTSSLPIGSQHETHGFVYIGRVNAPDALFLGRNLNTLIQVQTNQPIETFFANNTSGVFVDPLLNCSGNSPAELAKLFVYFNQYKITHVVGVKFFKDNDRLVENAPVLKQNAAQIAEQVRPYISFAHSNLPFINENQSEINKLVKKYSLPDISQTSLEKGMRNAATNNQLEDLKLFTKYVKNINATDSNPLIKRTALHWAAFKGHKDCYDWLLNHDATDSTDANGKKAHDYFVESQNTQQTCKP